ncbi:hypothetical protein C1645_837461 [Glomus cerebriforme]|uniref:Uncharacterized protein n=1 Tax=Glomus cerebriforme TaxID=658196 RepID=A0A397S8Q1_9GLOM|nr:hypothetical protein C1645_837461 [Glomus cerebriforme]
MNTILVEFIEAKLTKINEGKKDNRTELSSADITLLVKNPAASREEESTRPFSERGAEETEAPERILENQKSLSDFFAYELDGLTGSEFDTKLSELKDRLLIGLANHVFKIAFTQKDRADQIINQYFSPASREPNSFSTPEIETRRENLAKTITDLNSQFSIPKLTSELNSLSSDLAAKIILKDEESVKVGDNLKKILKLTSGESDGLWKSKGSKVKIDFFKAKKLVEQYGVEEYFESLKEGSQKKLVAHLLSREALKILTLQHLTRLK